MKKGREIGVGRKRGHERLKSWQKRGEADGMNRWREKEEGEVWGGVD